MNAQETGLVLAKAALYDPRFREPDRNIVLAWAEALEDVALEPALDAVKSHYRESRETIMPADVIAASRRILSAPYHRPISEVLAEIDARVEAERAPLRALDIDEAS